MSTPPHTSVATARPEPVEGPSTPLGLTGVGKFVESRAVRTCELAHAFSAAIGNTDAHLGTYGLVFDDEGHAKLAPLYDILPMALAPRHDELPDARITPRTVPIDPRVEGMVADLVRRVRESEQIDADFKQLWLRSIGA